LRRTLQRLALFSTAKLWLKPITYKSLTQGLSLGLMQESTKGFSQRLAFAGSEKNKIT
jgi:hypothetical protein